MSNTTPSNMESDLENSDHLMPNENGLQEFTQTSKEADDLHVSPCLDDNARVDIVVPRSSTKWTWRLISRLLGIYAAMIPTGMSHAIVGAILLELGHQTNVDVEKLALLFTYNFIGRMVSSFTVSAIFDRMHPEIQLGIISLLFISSVAIFPLTPVYGIVASAIAVQGFCTGYLTTGGTSSVFYLFKDIDSPGPYIQANYFAMAVGSMLAPLVAKPFLSEDSISNSSYGVKNGTLSALSSINSTYLHQETFGIIQPGSFYPAMIMSTFMLIPSIFFWLQFIKDKCKVRRRNRITSQTNDKTVKDPIIIILLFIAFYCALGIEVTYSGLLYTYAIKACNWESQMANNLITMFWAVYTVTRGISIFVAKFVRPSVILAVLIPIIVSMLTLMASASHKHPTVIWVASAGIAMASSLQVGTWFLLGNEYFPITGRSVGLFMTSVYLGGMTVPALTGYIFKNFSPFWMCYILLVLSIILLIDYIILRVYGRLRKLSTRNTNKRSEHMPSDTKATRNLMDMQKCHALVISSSLSSIPM